MRAQTKGKHEIRKRFAVVIGVAALGVMALGAQTVIAKKVIERPNGPKVPLRAMGEVSSNVSLDVFGAIDRQGHTYAFGGDIGPQAEIAGVAFPPGALKSGQVFSKRATGVGSMSMACSEYRTVTLFRVEPNGTSTRVASVQTGQGTGEFAGPLERPLGEITGYYYAEVAPATRYPGPRSPRSPLHHGRLVYKIGGNPNDPKPSGGAYYRALSCLPARSPTIFVEVPAALSNSQSAQTPGCLPTLDRTLGPHAFAGLGIKARAPVYTDALHFVFGGVDSSATRMLPLARIPFDAPYLVDDADALTSEGFVSGISQQYFGKRASYGDAQTVQLGSPEQAQAELNRSLAKVPRRKRFTVPAIPGSRGMRYRADGLYNSLGFTDGDYTYVISKIDLEPAVGQQRRALRGTRQVTKAAINLYNRVHGAAACP